MRFSQPLANGEVKRRVLEILVDRLFVIREYGREFVKFLRKYRRRTIAMSAREVASYRWTNSWWWRAKY